jgi:hypothetical protein
VVTNPMARPRAGGRTAVVARAGTRENSRAPNAPWTRRAATSQLKLRASPAATLARAKPLSENTSAGRRPTVSNQRPVGSASPANGSR